MKIFHKRKFEPDDSSANQRTGTGISHVSSTKVCMLLILLPLDSHQTLRISGFLKPYIIFKETSKSPRYSMYCMNFVAQAWQIVEA